ncbi:hypothetical protein LCGC14_0884070 [marine sediment metagenome]|uniref:Uncharacterized protein n=1 Tax=marine sediment metagenome TaxID=412755 RepID=A0A0F9P606_9ZZZZ
MPETGTTYTIVNDFLNSIVDTTRLTDEIEASAITGTLTRIDTMDGLCIVYFADVLSSADQIILDGEVSPPSTGSLIADHTGVVAVPPADTTQLLEWSGTAEPAVSPAGTARIYFDSTSKKLRISEDGGAYVNLIA